MTGTKNLVFVNQHTYDVSALMDAMSLFTGTTLNNAAQKALGDNKAKFSLIGTKMFLTPQAFEQGFLKLDL